MPQPDFHDEHVLEAIHDVIRLNNGDPESFAGDLISQMIQTCLKLFHGHDIGQLKLINRALKEMRYAYGIFNQYPNAKRVSIFGSARTPAEHPDFKAAIAFSMSMAKQGWMVMTGAAEGIMRAGIDGAQRESSFGLSIILPFEATATPAIQGDPKLMMFRYFFTRKLMFISHSDAIVAFPGGFGTLDELFEVLTLIQTGKSNIVPVVMVEGTKGIYWEHLKQYMNLNLLRNGWISPYDLHLYYIASSPADAKKHILKFYRRYHSSRYVKDLLVIRMLKSLNAKQLATINEQFASLVVKGKMEMSKALPEETDVLKLPRLVFHHTRRDFGLLRALIDHINNL